jgi:hypothetical protein
MGSPIYQSSDNNARVFSLGTDATHLFFFERRTTGTVGGPFDDIDQLLFCTPRISGNAKLFYQHRSLATGTTDVEHLVVSNVSARQGYVELAGDYVFWQQAGTLQRLPTNAEAIASTDLASTDIEVTQGIQNLNNSVFLVAGKKTFVRVHTQSFGAPVPGVPTRLWQLDAAGEKIGDAIYPINETGSYLTIQSAPDRNVVDGSFLFQLPWDWIEGGDLRLRAELNPWRLPPRAELWQQPE